MVPAWKDEKASGRFRQGVSFFRTLSPEGHDARLRRLFRWLSDPAGRENNLRELFAALRNRADNDEISFRLYIIHPISPSGYTRGLWEIGLYYCKKSVTYSHSANHFCILRDKYRELSFGRTKANPVFSQPFALCEHHLDINQTIISAT